MARPPAKTPPTKAAPPPTLKEKLEAMARSGYVDQNDAAHFIKDARAQKPERAVLRVLKQTVIQHQTVFDRAALHKLKTFFDTYKAENDVD